MSAKTPRLMLMACVLCPSLSWSLGLGEIHLNSALNQPLKADIDLVAATPEELSALRASLANREAFARYGIDRPSFLSTLNFKVGKNPQGRDVLMVTSSEAIAEPFVTFLVEVNWARGHLMREYTLLLDPPVYTPPESATDAAPVAAAVTPTLPGSVAPAQAAPAPSASAAATTPAPAAAIAPAPPGPSTHPRAVAPSAAGRIAAGGTYTVARGDTLTKIALNLHASSKPEVDQTMLALFKDNPQAFEGNINLLHQGAILRVPGADEIAALNQREAMSEVSRQMSAWRRTASTAAAQGGHLRLVAPSDTSGRGTQPGAAGSGGAAAAAGETAALKSQVKDLQAQLSESRRLLEIQNNELSALQRKLATAAKAPAAAAPPPATTPTPAPPVTAVTATPPAAPAPAPAAALPPSATPPHHAPQNVSAPPLPEASWLDWIASNWWIPAAGLVALAGLLGFVAVKRRQQAPSGEFTSMAATDVADDAHGSTTSMLGMGRGDDSFLVEESGEHKAPEFGTVGEPGERQSADDTLSSESAMNLDQGDPLAEADFHMAYGLYDQAADLVRIALEREPERRDLRMKLLEIYFVWGNKDAFLQTAKLLEATQGSDTPGEWDKIMIMGKQICPDDPMFAKSAGLSRGAAALVDLNLEGGENRVDIDLFGAPEGERSSLDFPLAQESDAQDPSDRGESSALKTGPELDFMLDAPERGADESPPRQTPPRDAPGVEPEQQFVDAPTQESPTLVNVASSQAPAAYERAAGRAPRDVTAEPTSEVAIDDLGLDLANLEDESVATNRLAALQADDPAEAPTLVAGLDERSRRLMAEAELRSRDRDLTQLERELEASFVAELDSSHDDLRALAAGASPTVQMPRSPDLSATSRLGNANFSDTQNLEAADSDSTSNLRSLNVESIDLDLDRLATAFGNGSGDTMHQPLAAEELFSSEVFEPGDRNRGADDAGEDGDGGSSTRTARLVQNGSGTNHAGETPEFEPVTMSEVGTKLDLARAYMDMGDPEGARNILEEVVQEGTASQKQEAQRLIQSLPG